MGLYFILRPSKYLNKRTAGGVSVSLRGNRAAPHVCFGAASTGRPPYAEGENRATVFRTQVTVWTTFAARPGAASYPAGLNRFASRPVAGVRSMSAINRPSKP